MDKIFERITKYDIFVNYTPGCAVVLVSKLIFNVDLLTNNIVVDVFSIYFYGIVSELLGTVLMCLLKKSNIISFEPYDKFIKNSSKSKVYTISRNVATYRSFLGSTILLLFIWFNRKCSCCFCLSNQIVLIYSLIFIIVIIININHQIGYLRIRINDNKNKRKKSNNKK